MFNLKTLGVVASLLLPFAGQSQAPTWSVNPNQYQYSMTVSAVIDLNCTELNNPSNKLGAFVRDTLRGVANTSTVINGSYQAVMSVYSDQVNGESVIFKFYDQSTDSVYRSVDSVLFQDNAIYGSPSAPFVVRTNQAPTIITLSNNSFAEGAAIGTLVGNLSTTDQDAGQVHSYSFVSGFGDADNGMFTLSGNQLKSAFVADYETKQHYSIRIRSTDSEGCYIDTVYTIQVTNRNDPPTALHLSSTQIDENNGINDIVATLSATDSDANESFTYTLVSGSGDADNAAFSISGNQLLAAQAFNYEVQNEYSIRLQVADAAANIYVDTFKVLINNLNESPTDIGLTSDSVLENQGVNTIVGMLSSVDEDAGQSFSYSFAPISGSDNASFNIVGNSLRTKAIFDYETQNTYFIYIQSDDLNGGTYVKQFTISIRNGNDAPTDIQVSTNSVRESMPIGTFVATLISTDQDTGSTFNYSLVNGVGDADNANFSVRNDSLFTNTVLNINTQSQQSIRLRTDDGNGGVYSKAFTFTVTDVNNAPTNLYLSNNIVAESSAKGITVGLFTSADADANDVHTYSLVSGSGDDDNDAFLISSAELKTDTTFDVNVKSQYSVRVRTTDNQGLYFEKALQINIINSNDAPTAIQLDNNELYENLPANSLVGGFTTTDPDTADTHTYAFVNLSANDNASFILVGNELRTSTTFDYETKSVYFIQVETDDGNGGKYNKQFSINILDTNDTPNNIMLSHNEVNEKQPAGEYIGRLTTVDQDAIDSYTYSLVIGSGSDDNSSFKISNDSLFSDDVFDILTKRSHSIRVRTTDSKNKTFERAFAIKVLNVNDAPVDINLSNRSIPENITLNSSVGFFTSSDIDSAQSFTYQLVSGNGDVDNVNFSISGDELKTNALFDYNNQRVHHIRVRTTDQGGLTYEKEFQINITNTNDAPSDIAITPSSFIENLALNTSIGSFTATDKDSNDVFTYSFVNQSNNDNGDFIIAGNELKTAANFNYEIKNLYIIEVQVRDQMGVTYSRQLTLNVLDSNDAPTNLQLNVDTLSEKLPKGSYVADLSTTDEDVSDVFSYQLVQGQGSKDNSFFRINGSILEVDSVMDYNDERRRFVRIEATDAGGKSIQKAFIINIKNRNDTPTDIIISDSLVSELAAVGTEIATLTTIDQDVNDQFTYSLVSGAGSSDNKDFQISGNSLLTAKQLDYETKSSYTIRLRTTDQAGDYFEKSFIIYVENGNEAPVIVSQNFTLRENMAIGVNVGQVIASDSDLNDSLSFRILDQTVGFTISEDGMLRSARAFDYENESTIKVDVEVSDHLGAADTAVIYVEIQDQVEGTLPTAAYLSPNGDGRNDYWEIKNVQLYSNYSLTIFSANGQMVYEKPSNYNNDWDGTMNGEQLPDGIYFYVLKDTQGTSSMFKGTITLKR